MKKKIFNFFYQFTLIWKPQYWFMDSDFTYSSEVDELMNELLDKYPLTKGRCYYLGKVELDTYDNIVLFSYHHIRYYRPSRLTCERFFKSVDQIRSKTIKTSITDQINKIKNSNND